MASLPFNVILSGIFLLISAMSYTWSMIDWLKYAALLAVFVGCPLIIVRAIASLRRWILDINVLMLVASIGAIALQEYHEAAAMVFLFGISQWLEDRCMGKAREAVSGLQELQPEYAFSALTNEAIPVEKIEIGDLLVVRPGDRVPVDGEVVSGASSLDESLLTGESRAVSKEAGSNVLSGSINTGSGSLEIRTSTRVKDSTIAQLAIKVEQAAMQRSETERAVEQFAKFYTPTIVISATVVAVLPLIVTQLDWGVWLRTSLVLLVTACPCALVISTPVTTVCGVSRAAQKSILIKGGGALEALSRVKAITFDKTGTLTEGSFDVVEIRTFSDMTEDEVLNVAASIEAHSSHPLAAAIVGSAAAKGEHNGATAVGVENIPGCGLIGTRNGQTVSIGNMRLLEYQSVSFGDHPEIAGLEKEHGSRSQKVCFVCIEKRIIGALIVADSIRKDAKQALDQLKSMRLHLGLLTGDGPIVAEHVAAAVGIRRSRIASNLIPEQKASILEDYRHRYGRVAHVGDGVNDSLALATADVGIAMGVGGSTMAIEAADVALFSNDITSISEAIKLSRRVRNIIKQNIVFSVSIKTIVIVLAFIIRVPLWAAVLADVGSALVVIANGLRLLGFKNKGRGGALTCIRESINAQFGKKSGGSRHACCDKNCGHFQRLSSFDVPKQLELTEVKPVRAKPCCSGSTEAMKTARLIESNTLVFPTRSKKSALKKSVWSNTMPF